MLIVCGATLEMYYLNPMAKTIFEAMDGIKTVDDVKNLILSQFEVSERELELDLVDIVRDFQWKRLVKLEG